MNSRDPRFKRVYCYDALAAAIAINPLVIKNAIKADCKVELQGSETRGTLMINWHKKCDYKSEKIMPLVVLETYYDMIIKLFIESTNP